MTTSLVSIFFVFFATAFENILWAIYIRRTGQGKALQSALISMAIVVIGGLVIKSYVDNIYLLIPSGCGAFVGHYITVKLDSKEK
jgi:hypothetical protein